LGLLAAICAAVGVWLGEIGRLVPSMLLVVGFGVLAVILPTSRILLRRVAGAFIVTACGIAGLYIGDWSFTHAYTQCLNKGTELRAALDAYHQKSSQYPSSLQSLP